MKKSRLTLLTVVSAMTLSGCVITRPGSSTITQPTSAPATLPTSETTIAPTSESTATTSSATQDTSKSTTSTTPTTAPTSTPTSKPTTAPTSTPTSKPTTVPTTATPTSASPTTTITPTTTTTGGGGSYYDGISTTATGDSLKSALYNLIKNESRTTSYDTLEVAMRTTDRNWEKSPDPNDTNPWMNLLYMVNNEGTPHRWNTYHGSGGMIDGAHWDKEHMWPKSNGFNTKGAMAYYDLHHLRASDMKNNNTRSNLPYGPVSSGSYVKDYDGNNSGYKSSTVYQPLARDRGDCARALFYMATRYSTGDGSTGTSLSLTDGTDSSGGKWGYLSTLLEWHLEDPPDAWEMHRNDLIYNQFQHNRNPFIDHPEYACRIWSGVSSKTKAACGN